MTHHNIEEAPYWPQPYPLTLDGSPVTLLLGGVTGSLLSRPFLLLDPHTFNVVIGKFLAIPGLARPRRTNPDVAVFDSNHSRLMYSRSILQVSNRC